MTNDYSNLAVCTKHFTLSGVYEGREHRCGCQPADNTWRQREWAGYDIAALIDLCHLCVRAVMASGSRWTWYACDSCRKVNNQIATAILGEPDPRNKILPLGRHSMMNGVALSLHNADSNARTERLIESVMELQDFWDRLSTWKSEEGERLVAVSGFGGLETVPLDRWLEANGASLGASADAMCRFVDEDLPDLDELDDMRRARRVGGSPLKAPDAAEVHRRSRA